MRHAHLPVNGITLHVVELGAGPPVVFCHGFPDTWRGWRRQMEAVAAAGYRAIAMDMRGYGETSAPQDASLYTNLHAVGDVVGLLDALELRSATIVGHDFGAAVAWNAALMRPDRFPAVFCLSIPFSPRGDKSYLQAFRDQGHDDFYMFSRMRPEADQAWADARARIPANLYWSSGAPPAEERWTLFNRDDPKYTRPPATLPAWADARDVADAAAEFARTGMHGALNWYRAIQLGFDLSAAFKGKLVEQPSYFVAGAEDGLAQVDEAELGKVMPGLRGVLKLPGVSHWPQLEASAQTNAALLGFLREVG